MNKAAKRVLIGGRSGSGKSTYVKKQIKKSKRLVIFDIMGEYSRDDKSVKPFYSLRELFAYISKHKQFKVSYTPQSGDNQKELFDLSNLLLAIQVPYESNISNAMLDFVVEEMNQSYPLHAKKFAAVKFKYGKGSRGLFGFMQICSTGRHYGINVYGVTQRIAEVDTNFRGNCNYLIIFASEEARDINTIVSILGKEYRNKVINLPIHHYLKRDSGKVTSGKNSI